MPSLIKVGAPRTDLCFMRYRNGVMSHKLSCNLLFTVSFISEICSCPYVSPALTFWLLQCTPLDGVSSFIWSLLRALNFPDVLLSPALLWWASVYLCEDPGCLLWGRTPSTGCYSELGLLTLPTVLRSFSTHLQALQVGAEFLVPCKHFIDFFVCFHS
jgi:hypothetical protein